MSQSPCMSAITLQQPGGVLLSQRECILFMFVEFIFVGVGVVCRFTSWVGCTLGVLFGGSLETLFC